MVNLPVPRHYAPLVEPEDNNNDNNNNVNVDEIVRESYAEGVRAGFDMSKKIYIAEFIRDRGMDGLQYVFNILMQVNPGESFETYNDRIQRYFRSLFDILNIPEDQRNGLVELETDTPSLICDYCSTRLSWGYDSWRCMYCPMFLDVCAECRVTKSVTPENCVCRIHQQHNRRDDMAEFMNDNRAWECARLIMNGNTASNVSVSVTIAADDDDDDTDPAEE